MDLIVQGQVKFSYDTILNVRQEILRMFVNRCTNNYFIYEVTDLQINTDTLPIISQSESNPILVSYELKARGFRFNDGDLVFAKITKIDGDKYIFENVAKSGVVFIGILHAKQALAVGEIVPIKVRGAEYNPHTQINILGKLYEKGETVVKYNLEESSELFEMDFPQFENSENSKLLESKVSHGKLKDVIAKIKKINGSIEISDDGFKFDIKEIPKKKDYPTITRNVLLQMANWRAKNIAFMYSTIKYIDPADFKFALRFV